MFKLFNKLLEEGASALTKLARDPKKIMEIMTWVSPALFIPAMRFTQDEENQRVKLFVRDFTTLSLGAGIYLGTKALMMRATGGRELLSFGIALAANLTYAGIGAVKFSQWFANKRKQHQTSQLPKRESQEVSPFTTESLQAVAKEKPSGLWAGLKHTLGLNGNTTVPDAVQPVAVNVAGNSPFSGAAELLESLSPVPIFEGHRSNPQAGIKAQVDPHLHQFTPKIRGTAAMVAPRLNLVHGQSLHSPTISYGQQRRVVGFDGTAFHPPQSHGRSFQTRPVGPNAGSNRLHPYSTPRPYNGMTPLGPSFQR